MNRGRSELHLVGAVCLEDNAVDAQLKGLQHQARLCGAPGHGHESGAGGVKRGNEVLGGDHLSGPATGR